MTKMQLGKTDGSLRFAGEAVRSFKGETGGIPRIAASARCYLLSKHSIS